MTVKRVEIKVNAVLDPHWSSWLENLEMSCPECGVTLLQGYVEDVAAFYGLLERIKNLGLEPVYISYR